MERILTVLRQLSSARKRVAAILIVITVLLVYWTGWRGRGSSNSSWSRDVSSDGLPATCLKDRIKSFLPGIDEFDAYQPPDKSTTTIDRPPLFTPYIGNGIFGLEVDENNSGVLWLKKGRSLNKRTTARPVAHVVLPPEHGAGVSTWIMHFRTGIVHYFTCYETGVYVAQHIYAHRKHSNLLVQEIRISNPTDRYLRVLLQRETPLGGKSVVAKGEFNVTSFHVDSEQLFYVATKLGQGTVNVPARDTSGVTLLTGIADRQEQAVDAISKTSSSNNAAAVAAALMDSHANTWQQLWSTGYHIQTSKAVHAVNGDRINATLYYILSQVEWNAQEQFSLDNSEGCYGKHPTLDAEVLWPQLDSVFTVNSVVAQWLLTLGKHGCHRLLHQGAHGVALAFVLSLAGLRFSNQHLELDVDPRRIERSSHCRGIHFGPSARINVSVDIGDDNKPGLAVTVDGAGNMFGCDAGCLDDAKPLSRSTTRFPVKLTLPLSPVLYVASNARHLQELRSAIHVREMALAPALEHHVIAMHRHGTPLGGLPTFFWITVSTLIVIFHLFLAKLIYNEYCSSSSSSSMYGSSSLSSSSSINSDRYRNIRYGKL